MDYYSISNENGTILKNFELEKKDMEAYAVIAFTSELEGRCRNVQVQSL
jgi:hypothetical protein